MESLETLAATPARVRALVEGLTDEQLSWKEGDAFSMRENVLHLRDIDADGYELRVARVLDEVQPSLPDVNGAKLASERRYNEQPVAPALDAFAAARARTIARLRAACDGDYARGGTLEGVGAVTLWRLLELWQQHDREHLEEMTALRAKLVQR